MPDFIHNLWCDIRFRRRLFGLVVFACLLLSLLVSLYLPRGYRAEVWLLLDATPAATSLAPGATAIRPAAELEIAERALMTTETLVTVASHSGIHKTLNKAETAEAMRAAIRTRRLIGGNRASLLHITFVHSDPAIARETAEALARQVLASDIKRQTARADQAVRFASLAVAGSAEELAWLDAEILTLRQSAGEAFPDTIPSRLALRAELQSQLRQVANDRLKLEAESDAAAQEEAERVFVQLQRARQERQRAEEFSPQGSARMVLLDARIAELDETLKRLTSGDAVFATLAAQISLMKSQERALQDDLQTLQQSIEATPENAGRLEALLRQRGMAELQQSKTLTALNTAQSWQEAIRLGAANRWSLVDVPLAPRTPEGISLLVLAIGSAVLSLLAGVGAVLAISHFSQTIRSPYQITEILGTGPLLEIPPFQIEKEALS
ncbi:GumC domain-containing protein [Actibacterium pelagium]|uniref:Polysaccharide chain length determinant N-terminal domain-containing protein n=1 Tax=Actibacterium pelagium TaxID=2029103 RepID=A0A917AJ21_9RHOB|nr:hypothetical protein [Actibacterium pelagium]GGE56903.1 hypothetical protein GCM10011517_25850 [Actibacterium pelagium]